MSRKIAIIGAGISGMAAAWLLRNHFDVHLYEKNAYFGGHSHTVTLEDEQQSLGIDTGFMVYNQRNYPNLVGFFERLGVETYPTDMSFAVSMNQGELEYAGNSFSTLFAQPKRFFDLQHWGMLRDIVRLNKAAHQFLDQEPHSELSLDEFLSRENIGRACRENYLLPMAAAIWSCPKETMGRFPARSLLQFFKNHGLINLKDRPKWRTVKNGSQQYVQKLIADLDNSYLQNGVIKIETSNNGYTIQSSDHKTEHYEQIIFACHSDEARALLPSNATSQKALLENFTYQANTTYLHSDESLMPRSRKVWSSWNYLGENQQQQGLSVTYWMNRLQNLATNKNYFVSLNPLKKPRHIHRQIDYSHPVFDANAVNSQAKIQALQGQDGLWFCGAYLGYGFHEDGLSSAVKIAEKMGVPIPWKKSAPQTSTEIELTDLAIARVQE